MPMSTFLQKCQEKDIPQVRAVVLFESEDNRLLCFEYLSMTVDIRDIIHCLVVFVKWLHIRFKASPHKSEMFLISLF